MGSEKLLACGRPLAVPDRVLPCKAVTGLVVKIPTCITVQAEGRVQCSSVQGWGGVQRSTVQRWGEGAAPLRWSWSAYGSEVGKAAQT